MSSPDATRSLARLRKSCLATSYSSPLTLGLYSNLFSKEDTYLALQKHATSKQTENATGAQAMLAEATKRMSNPKLSFDAMNDFVKGFLGPWPFTKRGSQGEFEKESDFLRLSPPQLQ